MGVNAFFFFCLVSSTLLLEGQQSFIEGVHQAKTQPTTYFFELLFTRCRKQLKESVLCEVSNLRYHARADGFRATKVDPTPECFRRDPMMLSNAGYQVVVQSR
ncbi:hypothetical protein PHET_03591 [Paragonimus heterotremus]|uniref:Secreted protein n=1 Tax=Paragonimus heterotremus TaxID=100268 RepID=A0A8J4TE14_9TREM|nr:hypothetical protein PHET_03591 [Paragonimus heterotremus]